MPDRRYHFGPLERRGLLLGLRAGQLGSVLAGAVIALTALSQVPSVVGIAVAGLAVTAGIGVAVWPVAGRTLDEWVPAAVRWTTQRSLRRHRHIAQAHLDGCVVAHGGARTPRVVPPPPLAGVEIIAAHLPDRPDGPPVGVIRDRQAGTYTAVLGLQGDGFALCDAPIKERRLVWWGSLLDGLAREGCHVHRLQWLVRSTSDAGTDLAGRLGDSIVLPHTARPAQSYRQLLAAAAPAVQMHTTHLALQLSAARSARAIRRAGGGDIGACAVLLREVTALWTQLVAGELLVDGLLQPSAIAALLRAAVLPRPANGETNDPWPHATEASWSSYRTDLLHHATYWVREWPRIDVGPDFLAPLLLQCTARRTVAMTMQVEPPLRAQRDAEAAMTADLADADMRERAGFIRGVRRRREEETVLQRGEEIAAGHASVRFSAYVTVTATSNDTLDAACADVEQRAQQAHLDLHRLCGEQDVAFTYTLPLARGLR